MSSQRKIIGFVASSCKGLNFSMHGFSCWGGAASCVNLWLPCVLPQLQWGTRPTSVVPFVIVLGFGSSLNAQQEHNLMNANTSPLLHLEAEIGFGFFCFFWTVYEVQTQHLPLLWAEPELVFLCSVQPLKLCKLNPSKQSRCRKAATRRW